VSVQATIESSQGVAVDVWVLRLDPGPAVVELHGRTLDAGERARAARLVSSQSRRRFVAARGQLRRILGSLLSVEPADLRFVYGEFGKPWLRDEPKLRFNLSHTGDMGLLAVAENVELGVDIESNRPRERGEQIARRLFAPCEIDALVSLPVEQRDAAFLRCWTRKEAYVKALGGGLQAPLDSFAVSLSGGQPARLSWCRDPGELDRWALKDVSDLCDHATAAVCVEGHEVNVLRRETKW
jgi:4'-phosphopantetheinyl transferase